MMDVYGICQILLLFSIACGLYRIVRGPDILDRILAFDYLCGVIIGFIVLYSLQKGSVDFLELIVIFCLLGFATVVSFMEMFFARRRKSE